MSSSEIYKTSEGRGAWISDDNRYRYALWRSWSDAPPLVITMCNPSTADASIDDATIRKCVGFAQRAGCGGICVVNLYAYRSSNPTDLQKADDPVGPQNSEALEAAIALASQGRQGVLAAWGACARDHGPRYEDQVRLLKTVAAQHKVELCALKIALDMKTPCHPLMLPYALPLRRWVGFRED